MLKIIILNFFLYYISRCSPRGGYFVLHQVLSRIFTDAHYSPLVFVKSSLSPVCNLTCSMGIEILKNGLCRLGCAPCNLIFIIPRIFFPSVGAQGFFTGSEKNKDYIDSILELRYAMMDYLFHQINFLK